MDVIQITPGRLRRAQRALRWAEAYRAGESVTDIAARDDVHADVVRWTLKRLGIEIEYRLSEAAKERRRQMARRTFDTSAQRIGLRAERVRRRNQQWAEEYAAGASLQRISERHGVSYQRVQQVLRAGGVEMRPRGRPAIAKAAATREPRRPTCPPHMRRLYNKLRAAGISREAALAEVL
ncbi:hypothetical protein M0638_28345, partial [Roseomonas sp. NAR14]